MKRFIFLGFGVCSLLFLFHIAPSVDVHIAEPRPNPVAARIQKDDLITDYYSSMIVSQQEVIQKLEKRSAKRSVIPSGAKKVILISGMTRAAAELQLLVKLIIEKAAPDQSLVMEDIGRGMEERDKSWQVYLVNDYSSYWEEVADHIFTTYQDPRKYAAFEKLRNPGHLAPELVQLKGTMQAVRAVRFYMEWQPYSDYDISEEWLRAETIVVIEKIVSLLHFQPLEKYQTLDILFRLGKYWKLPVDETSWGSLHTLKKMHDVDWRLLLDDGDVKAVNNKVGWWIKQKGYVMNPTLHPMHKVPTLDRSNVSTMIIAAGMPRSGSTWLFNILTIISSLYFNDGKEVSSGWNYFAQNCQYRTHCVVKTHKYPPEEEGRANFVFTARRDIKEVWASNFLMWGYSHFNLNSLRVAMFHHNGWNAVSDYEMSFEAIETEPEKEIIRISEALGIYDVDPSLVLDEFHNRGTKLAHEEHRTNASWSKVASLGDTYLPSLREEFGAWAEERGYVI